MAHKQPAYLAINPNGKVPALVDGARTLWESNAILCYLAGRQDTPLWPKSDVRYDILKWLSWESSHFNPTVAKIIGQVIFAPMRGGTPDQEIIKQGITDFRHVAAIADANLKGSKFLVGDSPTVADFSVAVWLSYESICGLPVADFSNLSRWWKAMQALTGGTEFASPKIP